MDFEEYLAKFEGATGTEYLAYTVGFEEGKLHMAKVVMENVIGKSDDKDS